MASSTTGDISAIGSGKVTFTVPQQPTDSSVSFTSPEGPVPPCGPMPSPDSVQIRVDPVGPPFRPRFLVTIEWEVNGSMPRTISYALSYV